MSEEIQDFIQSTMDKNYTAASDQFTDIINRKMSDALEQQKIAVASQIFNGGEPQDDDYDASEEIGQQDDADLEVEDEIDDEDLEVSDEELDEIDYSEDDEEVEN